MQVFGQHAVGGIGLKVHVLDPSALEKVVDIGAAKGRRNGVVNGSDRNPQRARFFHIHGDPVLWNIVQPVGPHPSQPRILGCHVEDLPAGLHQTGVTQTATVLQLKINALGIAQFGDRRRREDEHHGVTTL